MFIYLFNYIMFVIVMVMSCDIISDITCISYFLCISMVLQICSKHSCEKQSESLEKHECLEQNDGFANLLEAFV